MNKAYLKTFNSSIQQERDLLNDRLMVLNFIDLLTSNNFDFYNDEADEIIEPWKSIFSTYVDVLHEGHFVQQLQAIQKRKNRPNKRKSKPKRKKTTK